MRTLTLIRHGKSSWKYEDLEDFERPLNLRGSEDVPIMARRFMALGCEPDYLATSYATRALTTARLFANQLVFPVEKIQLSENLYGGSVDDLYDVVTHIEKQYFHACLFGHNPGFTEFANELCGVNLENIPTAGFVHIRLPVEKWSDIAPGKCELLVFDYPKKDASLAG